MPEAAARGLKYLTFAGLAAALAAHASLHIADLDLWHQLALAREIFATGRMPVADPFAYTPTHRMIHHEWGAGMVAYLLSFAGPAAILLLHYGLMAGVLAVCLRAAARTAKGLENWGVLALPAVLLLSLGFLPVRAHAWSYLFTAWLLSCLARDEAGSRRWIAPWLLAFPLWVNLHAGFAAGMGLLAAFWLERLLRREPHAHLLGVGAAMAAAVSINPWGVSYYGFLWHALTMPRPRIAEWGPAWTAPQPYPAALAVCVLLLLYAAASAGRRAPRGILLVAAALLAALLHRKMLPIFAVAWLCYVPGWLRATRLGEMLAGAAAAWRPLAMALWGLLLLASVKTAVADRFWELRVPANPIQPGASHPVYPAGAAEYLSRHRFAGNVLTPFNYGAYVSWKLYPAVRVSLDSRYEAVYPAPVAERLLDLEDARPGWQATLSAYPTDLVLMPLDAPLARAITTTAWRRVYRDAHFALWARPGLEMPAETREGRIPEPRFP